MVTENDEAAAVLLFHEGSISKAMLWSEFEALLDRYAGIPEFAEQAIKIAYVRVNLQRKVTGLCFFKLKFDEDGYADPKWNIPIKDLLEDADEGPDLGAGDIALVCKSQTPEPMFENMLLDPSVRKGANDFIVIRDYIAERGDHLGLPYEEVAETAKPATKAKPAARKEEDEIDEDDIPVVQPAVVAKPAAKKEVKPAAKPRPADDHWLEEREILMATIKQLKVSLQTAEEQWEKDLAEKDYLLESLQAEQAQKQKNLIAQVQTLKELNSALKTQTENQSSQLSQVQESLSRQQSEAAVSEAEQIAIIKDQYESMLEQKLDEMKTSLQQKIHDKDMELVARQEIIESMEERIHEIQRKYHDASGQSQTEFIEELKSYGIKAAVYHPGAGQITLELDELTEYLNDPVAYAARKCLVTRDRYVAWLKHHDNPVCVAVGKDGNPCGKPVPKVDLPRRFEEGISDVCFKCQGDRSIAAVVSLRR